jgi:hypothetical protein
MRAFAVAALLITALAACSKPTDIVLGPEPLKQLADQGDQFKKLPEQDRVLLAEYLAANAVGQALNRKDALQVTGRTVGEVLRDAHVWKAKIAAEEAEQKKRDAEAAALKAKVDAERKAIADRISQAVTVAIVDKRVLPKDFDAGRYEAMVLITVAIENKSDQTIKQLKGKARFSDATGDEIGWLPVDVDAAIAPHKTLRTDMGHGWTLNSFRNGAIENIAARDFKLMKTSFEPEAIAFESGEVLRAPE